MKLKKLILCIMTSLLVLSGCGQATDNGGNDSNTPKEDVTFTGVGTGHNGQVNVDVTFNAEGKILNVVVGEEAETEFIAKYAYDKVPGQIVEYNSVNVDLVSGATMTSNAIVNAVKDTITQAGFDVANYQTEIAKNEEKVTLDTDIVIVGAGGSGLAAAIEALEEGAEVILVETNGYVGGASLVAMGMVLYAADEQEAQEKGTISAEEMCDGLKSFGSEFFNEEIALPFLKHSKEDIDWFTDLYSGEVTYSYMSGNQPINEMQVGEYLYASMNAPENGPSTYYVDALYETALNAGAELLLNTTADAILTDENGIVNGVHAVAQDGKDYTINAKKVILASGGYGANYDMVMENTEMTTPVYLGPTSNSGFGIIATEALGAKIGHTFMPDLEGFGQLVYSTYGGPVVNENAEVLNENGEIIENLYAVGELSCVQVIDSYHVFGGANLAWNLYSGRIAGTHAATNLE